MIYYEIGIYNQAVRTALTNGDHVPPELAKWEEIHYFDIKADSEIQAIKTIKLDYPEIKGFRIECVTKYGE